jgi:AcrR family transcriptional regulator
MQFDQDPRRNAILVAALSVFARYGFKRVAMADIAQEASVSRPALYLVFPNKTAIFAALAQAMAEKIVSDANAAWPETKAFVDGLTDAGVALHLDAWRLLKGSPHGGELVSANSAIVGDLAAMVDARFRALVQERLAQAGQKGFEPHIIVAALAGIKDKAKSEDELITHIKGFADLVRVGLLGPV